MIYCLLFLSGCRISQHIDTHSLALETVKRHESVMNGWIFADLKGDHSELLLSMDENAPNIYSVYVQDLMGKVISQINLPHKIRCMNSLADPRNNNRWMFYSYNDGQKVFLQAAHYTWQVPLQREDKSFEAITRNDGPEANPNSEYYGLLYPKVLDDIDADGKPDLLCLTLDGFHANPRGLVLYDFETGKIKWRFDMPCNVNSLLWDDFDNNGTREIIFATQAVKNTRAVINGLDDASCFLGVLSGQGMLQYLERVFTGYGLINLAAADVDQDRHLEIYAASSFWGNELQTKAAAMYQWNGGRLIRKLSLDLPLSLDRHQLPEFLQKLDTTENYHLILTDKTKGLIALDQELKQQDVKYAGSIAMLHAIGDLNGDGQMEIVLQTADDYIDILDYTFQRRARIKNPFPVETTFSVNIVKTGLDTNPLVSIGSAREIRYYRYNSLPFWALIYRLFIAYSPYLSLIFMILFPIHIYFNSKRRKLSYTGVNYLQEGMLILKDEHRISQYNRSAFNLAANSNDPACKDLKLCFPQLYLLLQSFIASRLALYETRAILFPQENDRDYKVSFFRNRSLVTRYLIIFGCDEPDDGILQDRMQWADTARRLSHHVRRHITNIILALESLKCDADPARQEYYQIIRSEIDKVRIFTHSFQRFTELKDYDLKLQDIVPSIEHALSRIKLPENISLVKSWDLSSVEAYIEPIRFEEAITNVLNNALEAMPEGGNLHIMIKKLPQNLAGEGTRRILMEIEDNGKGIPAKYLEDIWKPFFTTNQSGTGIGIPETKKIIDSMGGSMEIQSEEGMGTTVTFWLKGE